MAKLDRTQTPKSRNQYGAWGGWRGNARRAPLGYRFANSAVYGLGFDALVRSYGDQINRWYNLTSINLANDPDLSPSSNSNQFTNWPITTKSGSMVSRVVGPVSQCPNYATTFAGGYLTRPQFFDAQRDLFRAHGATISCLFRSTSATQQFIAGVHEKDLFVVGDNYLGEISLTPSGQFETLMESGNLGQFITIRSVQTGWNDGAWHLASVGSAIEGNPVVMWIDGVSVPVTLTQSAAFPPGAFWDQFLTGLEGSARFFIGNDPLFASGFNNPFIGDLRSILFFNGLTTDQQQRDMYASLQYEALPDNAYGRNLSAPALAQLSLSQVRPVMFVALDFDSGTQYLHDSIGTYRWQGITWQGLGDFGGIDALEETADLSPVPVTMRLSGITPAIAAEALTGDYVLSTVQVYIGFVDAANVLVADPDLVWSGTMDVIDVLAGDDSQVTLTCESDLIELDRASGKLFTSTELQRLYPGDTLADYQPRMQDQRLRWAGFLHKPKDHFADFLGKYVRAHFRNGPIGRN